MRKTMWSARIEDFEDGDVLTATCERCGHRAYLPQEEIVKRVNKGAWRWRALTPETKIKDLKYNLRCTRCPVPMNSRPHHEIDIRVTNDGDRLRRK